MKNIFHIIAIIVIIRTLSACTTFDSSKTRGYMDQRKISENIHQIIAFNNKSTSAELIKTAAIYFAAKTTLEQDKKRFIILKEDFETKKKLKIEWGDESEIERVKEDGYIIIDEGDNNIVTNIKSTLLIELIDETDPRYATALNADKLMRELDPIINLDQ